jgi:hypothetical protein
MVRKLMNVEQLVGCEFPGQIDDILEGNSSPILSIVSWSSELLLQHVLKLFVNAMVGTGHFLKIFF